MYLFDRIVNMWTQRRPFTAASAEQYDDLFGFSVSLNASGDTLAVGAQGRGAVYVFERSDGLWTQAARLTANNDGFGWSVDHVEDHLEIVRRFDLLSLDGRLDQAADQSFGERNALIVDPFGHRWMLSQTIEKVSPEEMQRRWEGETGA